MKSVERSASFVLSGRGYFFCGFGASVLAHFRRKIAEGNETILSLDNREQETYTRLASSQLKDKLRRKGYWSQDNLFPVFRY